jgi:hypothetical protein
MSIKMERLESFLLSEHLKFRTHEDGHLVVGFATQHYVSPGGLRGIAIAVRLSEQGEYLECIAPGLYNTQECRHPDAVLKLLLAITQRSKMIRFECDPTDGEVRCSIECPIEDGTVTRRQFVRMLKAMPELLDSWDAAIRAAMDTGGVQLVPADSDAACR